MVEKNIQTPETGNSTTMKTRARKIMDPISYEDNENVILKALKNIKKEKVIYTTNEKYLKL